PFWGVQYHPESICTDTVGARIILSWWESAIIWLKGSCRKVSPEKAPVLQRKILERQCRDESSKLAANHLERIEQAIPLKLSRKVHWRKLEACGHSAWEFFKTIRPSDEVMFLRSGKQVNGSLFSEE